MILPTLSELQESFKRFKHQEALTWRLLFSPRQVTSLLMRYGYFQFFAVGGTGVVIDLGITWALTTYVYGAEHYFTAYLIGISVNLLWNFVLYSFTIFKTKGDHARRLVIFVGYSIFITWVNTLIVQWLVGLIGVRYYLEVIALVILVLSTINFFVFKLSLFKERT